MAEKLTRKELRGPDAFQKAGQQAREWLQDRVRYVSLGVLVIILGGACVAVASYVSNRSEAQALKDLGAALKTLDRPVASQQQAAPDPDAEPPFTSQSAKDESLIKALLDVRQKYPRSRAAITAELPIAGAQLRLGRLDEALQSFENFLKGTPPDEPLRAEALEGEGYVYEAKGQLDQAMASFDALSRDSRTEFLNGMGLYHRGRILLEQGKKQEAADAFSQISSAYPNSSAARLASERLAQLAEQGVKPAPPPATNLKPDAG